MTSATPTRSTPCKRTAVAAAATMRARVRDLWSSGQGIDPSPYDDDPMVYSPRTQGEAGLTRRETPPYDYDHMVWRAPHRTGGDAMIDATYSVWMRTFPPFPLEWGKAIVDGIKGVSATAFPTLDQMLPSALGVALSPIPIAAVVLMLLTGRSRANGMAFILGWVSG